MGATFQRLVNKVFADQIGHNMEVYVNDIVVERKRIEDHIKDIDEVFEVLRRCKVRLNLEKCVYGVITKKFLRFIVS